MSVKQKAAVDIRYLLDRGYPTRSAITYVCNHYRLDTNMRYIFTRVICPEYSKISREAKTVGREQIKGNEVWLDGYNVLIGVESALKGEPIYLCDDGFIRDIRGIFRNYHCSKLTKEALDEIFSVLAVHAPSRVEMLLDSQISKSGEMAGWCTKKMKKAGLDGCVRTSRHVDFDLKNCNKIVATSDGSIIDDVERVMNLQKNVLEQLRIKPITIRELD
jgi:hypothetical protein